MARIWCIRNTLVSAWLLFGAHCRLQTPNVRSGKPLSKRLSNALRAHTERFELTCFGPRKLLSKRLMSARQFIQNEPSLCYPFSSSLMSSKKEFPRGSIKQSTQAACSRIVWLLYLACTKCDRICLALIWCTLIVQHSNVLLAQDDRRNDLATHCNCPETNHLCAAPFRAH